MTARRRVPGLHCPNPLAHPPGTRDPGQARLSAIKSGSPSGLIRASRLSLWEPPMRLPRFRVRTLMIAVIVVALLLWASILGTRSFVDYTLASQYASHARGWRQIASRGRWDAQFASDCAQYFTRLALKYRRAMWRPWLPVAPDPHAPGFDQWQEQQRRAKHVAPDPPPPAL